MTQIIELNRAPWYYLFKKENNYGIEPKNKSK